MAERKAIESSQEFEKEALSNGVEDEMSIIENCKHVIKEVTYSTIIFFSNEFSLLLLLLLLYPLFS